MWKLLRVEKSRNVDKKWDAVFSDGEKEKRVAFGATGYIDYTMTSGGREDKVRRELYRGRHKVDLATREVTAPGYLSYFILWGDSVDMKENIRNYKKRFNL
jgi:hypothetical protein